MNGNQGSQFESVVPVGGWLPRPMVPKRRVPSAPRIVAIHAPQDQIVPFAPTAALTEALQGTPWKGAVET